MAKKHFLEMTAKEKFEYFKYSVYTYQKFDVDDYINGFDEEFLKLCLSDPYNSRLVNFLSNFGVSPKVFFDKLASSGSSLNQKQEMFLKTISILGNNTASAEIMKGLNDSDRAK